ncbi:Ger(x)C family spore germination C-terminal domain-containing protein [Anaerobacillus sp. MEB173]|uniref:Ger(x)C family spore germination C-terminal domain-containing protein n=1 Tax=Anaerobacillus sp. MEB173 TaxID=3383345 RepID=UPI003F8F9751
MKSLLFFLFNIELIANPIEIFDDITTTEIQKQVARLIEEDIRFTFQKGVEMNIDVYQLSHTLYKKSPSLWRESNVDGYLPLTPDSLEEVNINVKVIKSGKDKLKTVS